MYENVENQGNMRKHEFVVCSYGGSQWPEDTCIGDVGEGHIKLVRSRTPPCAMRHVRYLVLAPDFRPINAQWVVWSIAHWFSWLWRKFIDTWVTRELTLLKGRFKYMTTFPAGTHASQCATVAVKVHMKVINDRFLSGNITVMWQAQDFWNFNSEVITV